MRIRSVILFLLLLIPSGQYAWRTRDMPGFAAFVGHDAGILFGSAKGLAQGQGYRILSLPEQPFQTKYPILYPLYLSLIWRISPNFPENLRLAIWFTWPLLVVCLALSLLYYRREGFFDEPTLWIAMTLLSISGHMLLYGCNVFSETPFTCFLLVVLLLVRIEGPTWALAAGLAAGCAYLLRTAGLPLLIAIPAWYFWKKQSRSALAFAAAMLPFVLGWSLWTRAHMFHTADPALVYYTDYIKYEFLNVGLDNLHIVVWRNADAIVYSMGALFFPKVFPGMWAKCLDYVIAVAMISGVVRLARRGIGVPYALFAAVTLGVLLVWQYTPDERFLMPLFPLLAAGLIAELQHVASITRIALHHKDFSQRLAAPIFAAAVALICLGSVALQGAVIVNYLGDGSANREKIAGLRNVYAWIEQHLPPDASILSDDDPLLYLYTGRHGNGVFPLTRDWCYGDTAGSLMKTYGNIVPIARRQGLGYVFSGPEDLLRMTPDQELRRKVEVALRSNPDLIPIYQSPTGTLYRIRNAE